MRRVYWELTKVSLLQKILYIISLTKMSLQSQNNYLEKKVYTLGFINIFMKTFT